MVNWGRSNERYNQMTNPMNMYAWEQACSDAKIEESGVVLEHNACLLMRPVDQFPP